MTSKERLIAAINFQDIDRVPVLMNDGSSWITKQEGISYRTQFGLDDVGAEAIVKWCEEWKSDSVSCGNCAWMGWANAFGGNVPLDEVGATMSAGPFVKNTETDIPSADYDSVKETLLKNEVVQAMIRQISAVKKIVDDDKLIVSGASAPFTGAGVIMSPAGFMKAFGRKKRDPNLGKVLDFASTVTAVLCDLYTEAGTDVFMTPDPIASGDMIPLRLYQELAKPAYQAFLEKRHSDTMLGIHICGAAGDRLEDAIDLGAKIFSIDSMVDMEDLLKRADHKICIMGNLSPTDQLVLGTKESVYEESTRLLKLAEANGGGLLLSCGCDLPALSPLENVRAMAEASIDFKVD